MALDVELLHPLQGVDTILVIDSRLNGNQQHVMVVSGVYPIECHSFIWWGVPGYAMCYLVMLGHEGL